MKPRRFLQFLEVLKEEGRGLGFLGCFQLLWSIFCVLVISLGRGRPIRWAWASRVRTCYRCPIFDRSLRRCRPYSGSELGCGCWAPFAALFKEKGWATENIKGFKGCW